MNNKVIVIVLLIILVIGGFYYFAKNQYQPNLQKATTQQSQTNIEANTVTIENFAFNPGTLTIKLGTKVTWINQDSTTHKIKADTFNSGDLGQGDKFTFTFTSKGSFDYSCSIHPSMTGKIVVE
jgi:plastocyanin